MKVTSKTVNITPEYATELLAKSHAGQERRRNERHVKKLARIMSEGNWQSLNGDTIVLDTDGCVIDGQHRLLAVIQSQCVIVAILVTGVNPLAYYSIDLQSRPRSITDVLKIEGYSNCVPLASALRGVWYYRRGISMTNYMLNPAIQDLLNLLESDKDGFVSAVQSSHKVKPVLPAGMCSFLVYIFSEVSPADSDAFFGSLKSGFGFKVGDPVKLLRDRLLSDHYARAKISRTEKLGLCFTAWNYYRAGREVKTLRWVRRNGDILPEAL